MLKSTKWHIEQTRFDEYKKRIKKLSDKQIEANSTHVEAILVRMNQTNPSSVEAENTKNFFWLSEAEKSSIESEVTAKKPIGDTPAYRKFLTAIFPEKTPTFPYLADYDDAFMVVSKLSELFSKPVRLPGKDEAIKSLKDNSHLTGCRYAGSGVVEYVDDGGYA